MSHVARRSSARLLRPTTTSILTDTSSLAHLRFGRRSEHLRSAFRAFSASHALFAAASSSSKVPKGHTLEQPDKFRPPSHPQRIVSRRNIPRNYPGPPLSESELQAQKTKRYPHMFPPEGTSLHWFLTNKWIHVWITMTVLSSLALITLTQSFITTSPYGHLLPPFTSFLLHPISSTRESLSVISLHIEYETARTSEKRQQNILDAQKRRLYRRAHGMEDLDAEGEQGVDVRGLVPWDDGLTNKERREGGRRDYRTEQQVRMGEAMAGNGVGGAGLQDEVQEQGQVQAQGQEGEKPQRRKVKKWLGIW